MASGFGSAGKGARRMAKHRYFTVSIIAAVFLISALFLFFGSHSLAKLGLPVVLIVLGFVKLGADYLEKRANHLKRRAKQADKGAGAEEMVGLALADLPEEYRYFNDVDFNTFNIDHILIGPAGIFLVETKSHKGKVSANGDKLLLNGSVPQKDFLKQTWSQMKHLEGFLFRMTSKEWKVKPILCFTNAFVEVRRPVKGIEVVNLRYLKKFLMKQPNFMAAKDIEHLTKILPIWLTRKDQKI